MLKTICHYILIIALSAVFFLLFSANLKDPSPVFDIWPHLAALRELVYHSGNTLHPMFLVDAPQKDYAPFYFILAKLSVFWGKDVFLTSPVQ